MNPVYHLVWNLIRGGTEGQCARTAMALAKLGRPQRVVVFRREGFFLDRVETCCGPVEEIGIEGFLRVDTVHAVRRLAARLRKEQAVLLQAWDADAAIFGQWVARLAGVPLITSRRDLGEIYPPHKVFLMNRADRQAVAVVANARAIADAFVQRGAPPDRFTVIPNILDVTEFDRLAALPLRSMPTLPSGPVVVMVARLDAEKDVATWVRAATGVAAACPDAVLVVVGDGAERPRLQAQATAAGLDGRMFFAGEVLDVPALLRTCAVGVLTPKSNEGLSNTILEYMAAGLPVVATDCGGNRELVEVGVGGQVLPVGDADGLADATIALLRDAARRRAMGAHNRARVECAFRPDVIAGAFAALHDRCQRRG